MNIKIYAFLIIFCLYDGPVQSSNKPHSETTTFGSKPISCINRICCLFTRPSTSTVESTTIPTYELNKNQRPIEAYPDDLKRISYQRDFKALSLYEKSTEPDNNAQRSAKITAAEFAIDAAYIAENSLQCKNNSKQQKYRSIAAKS